MIFLSNRKLRLIIITLLLLIFCFFIGLFKPKAEDMSSYVPNMYCPNGSGFSNQVIGDKRYYGCNANTNTSKAVMMYNGFNNGNYDITGYIYIAMGELLQVEVSANGNACFITSYINDVNATQSELYSPNLLNYYCFNVEISNNNLNIEMNLENQILSTSGNKMGFARDWQMINHFEKSNTQAITNIQNNTNNINNSINDSTIDSSGATSSSSEWNSKNATNGTITQLLTLPITLLQAIVNGISTSCSSFSLGTLFGTNITLPCINLSNLIGDGLYTTIDILFSGFMILAIGKKLIKIFNDFTNLKSNQIDELYGGGK